MFFFDHAGRNQQRPASLNVSALGAPVREILNYYALASGERRQTDVPPVWKQPLGSDILSELTRLSHGKCAFCEQKSIVLQTYRFRPPAYARPGKGPDDKSCYLWLAFNWNNFFPICEGCLPSDKASFPVSGNRARVPASWKEPEKLLFALEPAKGERAILYYPGEPRHAWRSFGIKLDGVLTAKGKRAAETIQHFNLNRDDLVRRRKEALEGQVNLLFSPTPTLADSDLTFSEAEFGGAHQLLLRRISGHLPRRIRKAVPVPRVADTVRGVLMAWSTETDLGLWHPRAVERIREEDERAATPSLSFDRGVDTIPAAGTSLARLRQVEIKNYKSLENISFSLPRELHKREPLLPNLHSASDAPEAPCLLILGENATGKSSVLEAIAIACLPQATLDKLGLEPAKLTLNPLYMGAEEGTTAVTSEILVNFHDDTHLNSTLGRDGVVYPSPENLPRPRLFAYGSHRLFGKKARRGEVRHVDTLFRQDREISNPTDWLRSLAKAQPMVLNEVVSALRHIIQIDGEFEDIAIDRAPGDEADHCYINIKKQRQDRSTFTVRQRLDIASSGYRAVLALVCDVLQGLMEARLSERPQGLGKQLDSAEAHTARLSEAIVLIDEIEAHLHPRWKLNIMAGLRRAMPRVTFVVTSHDPLCLRGMFNGEVMMLNRYQNDGTNHVSNLPEIVERVADFDNIEELTVEQLLTSNLFQLFSTDDRWTDDAFSIIPTILAKKKLADEENGPRLSGEEDAALKRFVDEIKEALPFGRTEITQVVREAVASYVAERRSKDKLSAIKARDYAKEEIAAFLRGLVE